MSEQLYTTLNNGIQMPLLGLGVYDMHSKEAEQAMQTAFEIGYRLIDTAAMYNNEVEVGNAVRNSGIKRNDLFITTKLNNPDHGYNSTLRAFDESMKKLNIDYIDLYLIHWPIKGKRKDTWKALEYLYTTKQVRGIGVANYLVPFLKELEGYSTVVPTVNQVEFSPFLYLKDLEAVCKEKNIQLQSYTPLTHGKKLNDKRLLSVAAKYHKTAAQIILRWNMQHGISAIPKSVKRERLEENFDIFDFDINEEDMNLLDNLNENFRVVGDPIHMF